MTFLRTTAIRDIALNRNRHSAIEAKFRRRRVPSSLKVSVRIC